MRVSTSQIQQTGVNSMLEQQGRLSKVQEQLATGRRILNPSDDPSGSARALELAKSVETVEGYNRNIDFADSRMRIEESVLEQVGNTLTRVRELAVQANNATTGADGRKKIAAEVRQQLDQLVELGNSTDGDGEYLFAGGQSREKPFAVEDGEVVYRGDQSSRDAQVGPGRRVTTTHSGFDVFMDVVNGDGRYVSSAGEGNTGTGTISAVSVTDPSAGPQPYDIEFEDNGGTLQYRILDEGGNTVEGPEDYEAGEPIELDGLAVEIEGTPEAGDTFAVDRSSRQSIFETVGRFADALERADDSGPGDAAFRNVGNRTLQDIDQAQNNVLEVRSELGGRLKALDGDREANEVAALELKSTKSELEDLDYASAVSELSQRQAGLQAAQQSFSRIQGLSLFDYL